MEVLESLLKQLSKLKNIISNIKRLIVKGIVSIVFPIDRKLNNTSNNLEKSINTIKTELDGRKSIILLVMIIGNKVIKFMKNLSNKNVIILRSIILDIDKNDDYIYSSTNNDYDDSIINFVNWKKIKYSTPEETIDVGDLAYDFKNIGEDEFAFNIYFDADNNAKTNKQSDISANKKGKYLFCKDVIETIYNKQRGKNVKLDNSIDEKDNINLGCEFYKVKFHYGEDKVIAVVYELKNDKWKYTCSYSVVEGHNLMELYQFNILHEDDDYFNILSFDKTKLILDDIRMYRIENTKLNLGDIIIDISKDIITLTTVVGAMILLLKQIKIPMIA